VQYRYYGKASHMAADLKATAARVRRARPDLYATKIVEEDRPNADGTSTTVKVRTQPSASSSSRYYHALAQRTQ
jgi:hypothetical protein